MAGCEACGTGHRTIAEAQACGKPLDAAALTQGVPAIHGSGPTCVYCREPVERAVGGKAWCHAGTGFVSCHGKLQTMATPDVVVASNWDGKE